MGWVICAYVHVVVACGSLAVDHFGRRRAAAEDVDALHRGVPRHALAGHRVGLDQVFVDHLEARVPEAHVGVFAGGQDDQFLVSRVYVLDRVGDLDVVHHAFVSALLQQDELAAGDQADVSQTVADDQVRDDLVARQVVDVAQTGDVARGSFLLLRDLHVLLAG